MDNLSLIHQRISTRTYSEQVPGEDVLEALIDYARGLEGPFGHRARFAWVSLPTEAGEAHALGTYGMIRGAKTYLVGVLKRDPRAAEDYGYLFEKVLLKATALGLATCWLGGTFDRTAFSSRVDLAEGEFIPAISPVGFASAKARIKDALVITTLGARGRKPLKDLVWGEPGVWAQGFEAVRLGPSASNKQPWRMAADPQERRVHFYLEPTAGYNDVSVGRVGFPIQTLDLGIAWSHFELALADQGISGRWTKVDPGLAVSSKWEYSATWTQD
jgi:nitroreductase